VRSFLGLNGYYNRFIDNYASICAPLFELTKKEVINVQRDWGPTQEEAFQRLKAALTSAPVLGHPDFSPDAGTFVLDCDASADHGIGAVLSQVLNGEEKPIAYGSRTLRSNERNWCTTRIEMLSLVNFVKHFRYFLVGKPFLVRTDHIALKWLQTFKEPSGIIARWLEQLADYQFTVEHRPGKKHQNADSLSRRRLPDVQPEE